MLHNVSDLTGPGIELESPATVEFVVSQTVISRQLEGITQFFLLSSWLVGYQIENLGTGR